MIWMELTRTDVVFSRITMVLFMCRSKLFRNDLKLHGDTFQKIRKIPAKDEGQGGHHLATRVGARPLPRGPPVTSPTPYIPFRGEKNQRESFIAFYDMEPPPSPNLSREGWSGVRSGLRRGGFVAVVIINHPPSPISWCSLPCVSNSIIGLLDGDGLDEIYHVIE